MNRADFPKEMFSYFDLKWPENLWELGDVVVTSKISDFLWHLEHPFWATSPPESIFDLAPGSVLSSPKSYASHYRRVLVADTRYPLSVSIFNGLPVILDGLHRLSKLKLNGHKQVEYKVVPIEKLQPLTNCTHRAPLTCGSS